MGSVGKTVVLSALIKMEMLRFLVSCLPLKKSKCVCICLCMYWTCSEMLKWERDSQNGALVMAGGDKLQAICVIRFSNMESASKWESGLILPAEPATPGKQGRGIRTGYLTG